MKTDPRVRYTRMIIQTAFSELLQQKPVNRITVREVCDKAEINRSTFFLSSIVFLNFQCRDYPR